LISYTCVLPSKLIFCFKHPTIAGMTDMLPPQMFISFFAQADLQPQPLPHLSLRRITGVCHWHPAVSDYLDLLRFLYAPFFFPTFIEVLLINNIV
jgi:hypothetical protein